MRKVKSPFVGIHLRRDENGKPDGSFVVFRVNDEWFWQSRPPESHKPFGPFKSAESAYRSAKGDGE